MFKDQRRTSWFLEIKRWQAIRSPALRIMLTLWMSAYSLALVASMRKRAPTSL